jgi:hypothetical protein
MNLTVYVPKEIEEELRRRAKREGLTPALLAQSLLRRELGPESQRFSKGFAALAGAWEDRRTAEEVVEDIKRHRASAKRAALR